MNARMAETTAFLLHRENPFELEAYLLGNERLPRGHHVLSLDSAGDGNMNCTLRVTTEQGSFILKQSRSYVERYPNIRAPKERIHVEEQFYKTVRKDELISAYTPEILWSDRENHLLAMEDLGQSSDYSFIYQRDGNISKRDIVSIAKVLSELHFRFNTDTVNVRITNHDMRRLNYEHIFVLPLLENNGVDLDSFCPGLQEASEKFRTDDRLLSTSMELGRKYLEDGRALLHGDYYPGSWLRTPDGFRMIDPEFCFFGHPEFELAVAVAHLKMAQQPDSLIKELFLYYHFDKRFDGSLFTRFAGMEVIRRLIGVAQLPLELTLDERMDLLDQARMWVLRG
jgi:5-methylthioribose kinase